MWGWDGPKQGAGTHSPCPADKDYFLFQLICKICYVWTSFFFATAFYIKNRCLGILQSLLAEFVSSLQHLTNKVWWKGWCPQQHKHMDILTWSNPAPVHQVATTHFAAAFSHSMGILPFSLKRNTAGLSVWVYISHEAANEIIQQNNKKNACGKFVPQGDGENAALGYEAFHPTPPLWQGEALGNYFRIDCKLTPSEVSEQPVFTFLYCAGYEQQEEQDQSWGLELGREV